MNRPGPAAAENSNFLSRMFSICWYIKSEAEGSIPDSKMGATVSNIHSNLHMNALLDHL